MRTQVFFHRIRHRSTAIHRYVSYKSCDMMNYTNGKMRWMLPFTETECSKSSFYVTHGTQQHQRVDCDQVIYSPTDCCQSLTSLSVQTAWLLCLCVRMLCVYMCWKVPSITLGPIEQTFLSAIQSALLVAMRRKVTCTTPSSTTSY